MMSRRLVLAAIFASPTLTGAWADQVTVEFENRLSTPVEIQLYSQARDHRWPGDGTLFRLEPGTSQPFPLTCTAGESICWGAWAPGGESMPMGVGRDGIESCPTCCFTCDDGASARFAIGN